MTHVFFEEPMGRYRARRYVWVGVGLGIIAFVAGAILLGFALLVGVVDWGSAWRMNVESFELITIVGIASAIVFTYLLVTEGLSVRRALIADHLVVSGKVPRFFKRVAPPMSIAVEDIRRMELREGAEIPTLSAFRKTRLWLVRLTLKNGAQVEFRRYDPGFSVDEAWRAWRALGEVLKRRGVEVMETRIETEVP